MEHLKTLEILHYVHLVREQKTLAKNVQISVNFTKAETVKCKTVQKSIKQPKKRKVSQMLKTENALSKVMHDGRMYENALFVPQTESSRTANKRKNKRK